MTTLVKCAKEMRKCEEISRLDGAKDGGKEMPLLQQGGGGWFFAFVVVVICLLVGFLFLLVFLLLYFSVHLE